jgi:hypothetical protein
VLRSEAQHPSLCNDTQAMLNEAKRNLLGFLYVGLTEHYNASVKLLYHTLHHALQQKLGRAMPKMHASVPASRHINGNVYKQACMAAVTVNGTLRTRLDQILRHTEHLDLELYEFARHLFWARHGSMTP